MAMSEAEIRELCLVTHFDFDDGVVAFCKGEPREAPHRSQSIWRDLWLFGWDVAEAMTAGSGAYKNQREFNECMRRTTLAWRKRHPLFAVIDGTKNSGPA
jgi:hypothetical protein